MLLTVDVSAQHMMGPNIVPCFTTSLTCISSVFPTGGLIITSVSENNFSEELASYWFLTLYVTSFFR